MALRRRSKFALPLAVLLGLFGIFRLYGFSQAGNAADLLSGFGFIALALSYYTGAGYKADPGQRYPWHYATILGTVLILAALLMRLTA